MNKLKLFLENFLIYGIGGIISKIIPFVMLPIVTRLMPNAMFFGLSDLSNTIISFASALAVMGMYDAMYRMFFEKDDLLFKKEVCSTAFIFTLFTSSVVFFVLLILRKWVSQFFLGDVDYAYLVYIIAIATLVGATNNIISAPTRMQNKRKIFLITNTISPVLAYSISIPLLLEGYYVIALPLASVVSGAVMEISFGVINREWFDVRKFNLKLLQQMLVIAVPTLPTFLVYWVFNSCDKLMIVNMMDLGASGIYSVGAKLGHASQLIYTAFAGGWQFFAFSTMKEKNQVQSNSLIFEYLGIISFVATIFVCAWSYSIYKLVFVGDYVHGYLISPYLFLAPLLQMLFQVAGNQFLVVKRTWPMALILTVGVTFNIVANLGLIPILGIEGAAIATLLGYLISDVVCVIVLCRIKLMEISIKFIAATFVVIIYFFIWRMYLTENTVGGTIAALAVLSIYFILYKKDLSVFFKDVKRKG